MNIPVSVIILTQDEEINIRACLESAAWSDDVILVDSGSRDKTLVIAKSARPDVRIFSHPFQDFGDQRNWALDHTNPKNEWILFVDADERIPPACATAIGTAVRKSEIRNPKSEIVEPVGFYLAPRNYFLGRWIKHCSLYPSWQLRLLKKGHVRFQKEGHGQREVTDGPLGYIREPYDHFGFSKGLSEWMMRHNTYSSAEAEHLRDLAAERLVPRDLYCQNAVARRRCVKRLAARAPGLRPWIRFLYSYVLRCGFLDGYLGLVYCLLYLAHGLAIQAKMAERDLLAVARGRSDGRQFNRRA